MNADYADYTHCSLEELYLLARQIDSRQFPSNYSRVLVEIEKRGGKLPKIRDVKPREVKRTNKPTRPWREWILADGGSLRTAADVAKWWEARRGFWMGFVSILLFIDVFTAWFFSLLTSLHSRSQMVSSLMTFPFAVLGALFLWPFAILVSGIAFGLVSIADILFHKSLKFLGWRLSTSLFGMLLIVAIIVAVIPFVRISVSLLPK